MTSAAQLESTFAGAERAERAERQSRTGRRNVGRTRQLGLPAAPSEASERAERGRSLGSHMTALATNGAVAVDQSALSPRNATDHQDRSTGFGRRSRFSDEPSALSARRAAVGAQPAGRLDARAATGSFAPQSALERAPRAEQCSGDAEAVNTPLVPVASQAVAQDPGAGHAGALLPRPELNGHDSPFPAPSCAPDPVPVAAPSESLHTASLAPESSRDDPFAELSPGPVSAAPLLHPQRQRELIEQAAGMSTRQVAGLLAAAAPEVVPPRDTLRAVAPDRYTLKVSIDQECEQGLRRLKGLMSHLDPRMSWGDLVTRLVREALERHDPLGGGSGQRRRRSAGSAGVSPRRAPKKTPAAGAAAGPAQGVHESTGRAPNRTRAGGAPAQRGSDTPAPQGKKSRSAAAPAMPAQRAGVATPAPQGKKTHSAAAPAALAQRAGVATPAPQGATAAAGRRSPNAIAPDAAPPRQSAPAALADGARAGGVPSGTLTVAAAPQFAAGAEADGSHAGAGLSVSPVAAAAPGLSLGVSFDGGPSGASAGAVGGALPDGSHPGAAVPVSPVATSAPEPALGVSPDGRPSGASAVAVGDASADGSHVGAAVPISPVATSAPELSLGVLLDGGPSGASAGAAAHTTRDSVDSSHQSPPRRHIPAAVRRHVWLRDGGRCCYRDPLSGRRCTSSHLLQIDHLLPVAQGGGPEPDNLELACFAHHRMRHGHGPEPPM